ncbi:MAG: aromatic ring-opening dioxygenase subunit LigB [Chloroflexota bacterium]|nr:aromatic ring-opening dioxygenase subunit LigB [Chloroflexota bacterium]
MPLVFAAIAPHGFPLIPDLGEDAGGALQTRAAMLEMQRRAAAAGVEAVVIAGPHGVRVNDAIALADTSRAAGSLSWEGRTVEMNVPIDGELTDAIAGAARVQDIPIALVGYAGSRRNQSVLPLDWGFLTPLWFLGHDRNMSGLGNVLADPPDTDQGPPAVLVSPSRSIPREHLIRFGEVVAEVAEASSRRIAFVASCDWGHRHAEDGPYGFHPESAVVDAEVVAAVTANDLLSLRDLPDERAEMAAIDGLWQLLMLGGALQGKGWPSEVISYEAPTYYGMLVATWQGKPA